MRDGAFALGFGLVGFAAAMLIVITTGVEKPGAYARGYAAACDSVRAEHPVWYGPVQTYPQHYYPLDADSGYVEMTGTRYGYKRIGPQTFRLTRVTP